LMGNSSRVIHVGTLTLELGRYYLSHKMEKQFKKIFLIIFSKA